MWQQFDEFLSTAKEQYGAMRSAIGPLRETKTGLLRLLLRKSWHDLRLAWLDLSSSSQIAAILALLLAVLLVIDRVHARLTSLRRLGIPVIQPPKGVKRWDYEAILKEGARRYPTTPYIYSYSGFEYVVYPSSSFDEVKRVPKSSASMVEWFAHVFFQGFHLLGTDRSALHKTIAADLTRAVPSRVPERQEDARVAISTVLGSPKDWKAFPLYFTVQEIVARTNAVGLLGPKLGNDARWMKAQYRFLISIMVAVMATHSLPRIIRPVIAPLAYLPAWSIHWYMKRLLRPMLEEDLAEYSNAAAEGKMSELVRATNSLKFPITAWLVSRYPDKKPSMRQLADDYIEAAFESTSSTAVTIYNILAEIAQQPDLIRELREEISETMVDGKLPQTYLGELRKLDSVMRESFRKNIFQYMTLFRKVLQPIQLSSGPQLPAGSLICADAYTITRSKDLWGDDPERFDPFRFAKLRAQGDHDNQHLFTSLQDSHAWGGGSQACPGRVFAGNTIKIILTELLSRYDIQLPSGAGAPKRQPMPNGSVPPDLSYQIMIKKVITAVPVESLK